MKTISDLKQEFLARLTTYTPEERLALFYIFVQELLGINRPEILFKQSEKVNETTFVQFQKIIEALEAGKPYQQILGKADFFGMRFFVNEHVLIPRPETEELLELALHRIEKKYRSEPLKILDIGTGSGIIPIILKKNFPNAEVSALDISEEALEVAQKNAQFHQTDIQFRKADFLSEKLSEVYQVIISNPPYIGRDEYPEIAASVKEFEPQKALFTPSEDTLIFYRKIAETAHNNLADGGMIFLEINQKLGAETLELFNRFHNSELIRDISGNNRMIFVEK